MYRNNISKLCCPLPRKKETKTKTKETTSAGGQTHIGTTGSCHVLVVPGTAVHSPLAPGI